ncbi:hypothetical protein YB2330_005765 [Saitoella coloradoensis]
MTKLVQPISLYRSLLRAAQSFSAYNFRDYALRRTKDAFRANRELFGEARDKALQTGANELKRMKRQAAINGMYQTDRLVVEGGLEGKDKGGRARVKDQGWD